MITTTDTAADEFLAVSRRALRSAPSGTLALDTLGWWDLLEALDDRVLRFAAFALFRAQGHELADTPALGALMAQPYAQALGISPKDLVVAVPRRGSDVIAVGDIAGRQVVVADARRGPRMYDGDTLARRSLRLPGRLTIDALDVSSPGEPLRLPGGAAASAARASVRLGRIAAAAEMLGAAEGAVDLAVDHAKVRTQFGQTLGSFQAVKHLLAWATTDCAALAAVVRQAIWFGEDVPERHDEITKALAGRNARRACERSMQALGGIAFTAEHQHHHHHSRVLLLDGVLGRSSQLTHELGSWLRQQPTTPVFTAGALALDE